MAEPTLTIMLPIEVEATLTLTYTDPKTGQEVNRPVAGADLRRLCLRHENDMYNATVRNLRALGLDESEGVGADLRYLIEHTTHWDGVHDLDPTTFTDLMAALNQWTDGDSITEGAHL